MGATLRVGCPPAALAALAALALAGCGGGSHAAGTPAADAGGAPAPGAGTTGATSTAGATTGRAAGTAPVGGSAGGGTAGSGSAGGQGGGVAGGGSEGGPGGGSARGGAGAGGTAHGHARKTAGHGSGGGSNGAGVTGGGSGTSGAPSASTAAHGVPFEVSTTSMEPTYKPETTVYYDPTRTQPKIGEVIVFHLPAGADGGACREVPVGGAPCRDPVPGLLAKIGMKRVVGLPGDTIAIRDGHVIRNGQPEPEPPTLPCGTDEQTACEYPRAITVPAGHYYVMADYRAANKEDSRVFGAVPQEAVLGTVEGS
jgi:signal peptidase I